MAERQRLEGDENVDPVDCHEGGGKPQTSQVCILKKNDSDWWLENSQDRKENGETRIETGNTVRGCSS